VRLHGPQAAEEELRELLAEAVEECFAALPPPEDGAARQEGRDIPPMDAEDAGEGLHADRSLLWTRYQRSHVSLGGKPLLDDDGYAARMTTCLARSCEAVLEALCPNSAGQFAHGPRQTALLRLVAGGLGALGFGVEQSSVYLAYHRDWLLRFTVSRSSAGPEKIRQTLARFDQRAEELGSALDSLRTMALETWSADPGGEPEGAEGGWWRAVRDLQGYLDRFRGQPEYQLDPYATDVVFPPVFKVFHGSANQLGLNMLNEALAHHLLLKAVTDRE